MSDEGVSRLDVEKLADTGPSEAVACGVCGTPTSSHVVYSTDTGVHEVDEDFEEAKQGELVLFAVVCHSCWVEDPDPAEFDGEGAFEGVVA